MEKAHIEKILWDFFIAHSSHDKDHALKLYELLSDNGCRVFLDQKSITLGETWDQVITSAIYNTRITLVLISENVKGSHFAREEIQQSIQLTRANPQLHKVIPIYLNGFMDDIPYGLRLVQGISITESGGLAAVVQQLLSSLAQFKSNEAGSLQGAREEKSSHVLLSFPGGPLIPLEMVPRSIIEAYASFIKESESKLVVAEANAFRKEASPDTSFIIPLHKILSPDRVSAYDFWMDVFNQARLQGPRMLAALLLTVPDEQFPQKARDARAKFLRQLKTHS